MTSGLAHLAHIILGLAIIAPGCTSQKRPYARSDAREFSSQRAALNQGPARKTDAAQQPAQPMRDDRTERAQKPVDDDPEASAQDVQPTAKPIYTDPGARWIVQQVVDAMRADGAPATADAPIRINVTAVRNQSRAQSDEFDGMLERLADLLSRAGRDEHIRFTADPAAPAQYRLKGTAYMLNAAGFDQWELYLSLVPEDRAWTVWSSDVPVRMLRASRPRSQQLFPLTNSR